MKEYGFPVWTTVFAYTLVEYRTRDVLDLSFLARVFRFVLAAKNGLGREFAKMEFLSGPEPTCNQISSGAVKVRQIILIEIPLNNSPQETMTLNHPGALEGIENMKGLLIGQLPGLQCVFDDLAHTRNDSVFTGPHVDDGALPS